jgi:HK97 family phage portal protein
MPSLINSIGKFFNPDYNDGSTVQAIVPAPLPDIKAGRTPVDVMRQVVSSMYTSQGTGYPAEFTWRELVASYSSWVYTSVDKISKTVAGAPKRLFAYVNTETGKYVPAVQHKAYFRANRKMADRRYYLKQQNLQRVEITEHPLIDLLYHPNKVDSQFEFWCEVMQRLELAGACGILKIRNRLGVPGELWVLPFSENGELKPIPDRNHVIAGYRYTDGDIDRPYTPEEIIWIRYPNPKDKFEGMSALKAQQFPYNLDYFLMKQQYKFFKNGAVIGNVLTTEARMNQDELDKLYDKLVEKFGGTDNAGKWLILHSGLQQQQPMFALAKDLMVDEIAKFTKDKMLSGYGVNEGIVGLTENQNKANLDASREIYLEECVGPRVQLIIEKFEDGLISLFDDRIELEFDLPQVQQRELDIAERRVNIETSTTVINEERAKMKLDPVPWGDQPWIPFNLSQPDAQPELPQKSAGYEKKALAAMWKASDLAIRKSEPAFKKTAKKLFQDQAAELEDKLQHKGAVLKGNIATQNVKRWLDEHKSKLDELNIDKATWEKETTKRFKPVFTDAYLEAGKRRVREFSRLKAEFDFNMDDPEVQKWIGTKLREFSKEVTGTTFDAVEKTLREGFEQSRPLSEIASELRSMFADYEVYRAELIARTEAANTYNAADLEAVNQLGLEGKVRKFWLNEPDARDTHQQAGDDYNEGNAIGLDDEFEVGGDKMQHPGGGALPEENINCRCVLGYTEVKE